MKTYLPFLSVFGDAAILGTALAHHAHALGLCRNQNLIRIAYGRQHFLQLLTRLADTKDQLTRVALRHVLHQSVSRISRCWHDTKDPVQAGRLLHVMSRCTSQRFGEGLLQHAGALHDVILVLNELLLILDERGSLLAEAHHTARHELLLEIDLELVSTPEVGVRLLIGLVSDEFTLAEFENRIIGRNQGHELLWDGQTLASEYALLGIVCPERQTHARVRVTAVGLNRCERHVLVLL